MKKRFLSIILAALFIFPYFAVSAAEWCEISLPSTIYGVVGYEMNVYFDNVIMCNDLTDYQIAVECSKGMKQENRWTYTPQEAGSFSLKITVYKNGAEVSSAQTTVRVRSTAGTGATKKVLFIGDSWTDGVYYPGFTIGIPKELAQWRFADDGDNIQLVGTINGWGNENIWHEGRSGWTTENYCHNSTASGRDDQHKNNPFYNSASGKFDFSYYLTQNSIDTPDVVIIFLGINDAGKGVTKARSIENFNAMISSIHSVSNSIKIGIVLTPPPGGTQDGFGARNLCGTTRFMHKYKAFNLMKAIIDNFDGGKVSNVSVVPVNVNVDCIGKYETEEVPANAYTTVTVKRLKDNVHPSAAGYIQVADSMYAFIKSLF